MAEETESGANEPSAVTTPAEVAPAPSGSPPAARNTAHITPSQILIVLGAVGIIVSLFLHWLDVSAGGGSVTRSANGVPVQFLFDRHTNDNDPSLLVVLIPAAAVGLLGAATHKKALAFIGSIVSLFVAGAYVFQLNKGVDDINDAAKGVHVSLSDFLGIAPYVCAVGGILMLVGAIVDRAPSPAVTQGAAPPPSAPPTA